MKIAKIALYAVALPMKEGAYSWSNQSFTAFDSTVVEVTTDDGQTGYGEICRWGRPICPPTPRAPARGS